MAKNVTKGKPWWDGYRATCNNCGTSFDVERTDFAGASQPTDTAPNVQCPECQRFITIYRPLETKEVKRSPFAEFPIRRPPSKNDPLRRW